MGDCEIVNVERRRYDIKRSEDGVKEDGGEWETVFTVPKEDVSWDTAFAVYEISQFCSIGSLPDVARSHKV